MNGIIYRATCKTTGLCYIGQTVFPLEVRMKSHKRKSKGRKGKFYDAIRQYGWEDFVWEILEECDEHILNEREVYWISYYNSYLQGYNGDGGGGYGYRDGHHHSATAKQLISNKIKQVWNDEKYREYIRERTKEGMNNPITKRKCSDAHKGTHRVYDNSEHTKWHMEK